MTIGAEFQPGHPVDFARKRRQHDARNVDLSANFAERLEAGESRQGGGDRFLPLPAKQCANLGKRLEHGAQARGRRLEDAVAKRLHVRDRNREMIRHLRPIMNDIPHVAAIR